MSGNILCNAGVNCEIPYRGSQGLITTVSTFQIIN